MSVIIGLVMPVYGLLAGEFSISELGERAPIQLTGNSTCNGQLFFVLIISVQFLIGGTLGTFGRALLLKSWCNPLIWDRLKGSKWRPFINGYFYRLMVWLLDLPSVPETEQANR